LQLFLFGVSLLLQDDYGLGKFLENEALCLSTYNRARTTLPICLESIRRQDHHSLEVIIVDTGSVDNTRMVVRNFAKKANFPVRYFYYPTQSFGKFRKYTFEKARSDIFCLIDDDFLLCSDLISKLVDTLQNSYDLVAYNAKCPYRKGRNRIGPNGFLKAVKDPKKADVYGKYAFWRYVYEEVRIDDWHVFGYIDVDFWLSTIQKGFRWKFQEDAIAYHLYSRVSVNREQLYFFFKFISPNRPQEWLKFVY
jgi:glycosyltransferase involved in cell wall biosynthesis